MPTTINGWNLITLPSSPAAPKSLEWQLLDVIGTNRSPFSMQQQFYDWGQALLRVSVSYQPMLPPQAAAWEAFLMACGGVASTFLFGDPLRLGPINAGATGGTVTGGGQTGRTLVTSSSDLSPGDWISVGVRLYRVLTVSAGTLGIWPPIRESPAGGTTVVITNTQGLFRLSKNDRKYSVNDAKVYGFSWEFEEAL